jgi:hypothetical protein
MAKKAAKRTAAGSARKGSAKSRSANSRKKTAKKAAGAGRTGSRSASRVAARKKTTRASKPARKAAPTARARAKKAARPSRRPAAKKTAAQKRRTTGKNAAAATRRTAARKAAPRRRTSGRERDLDQTPETGRSVKGLTNPFPTKRSTGTAAGAGGMRLAPGLERARRHLREVDETVPSPPSSLTMDRRPSAARTGRQEMREARRDHPEVNPDITGGDVDADWASAYDAGDEAPGGDNPTPDQDRVDDIGKALGVQYEDNEELKASDKIAERDKRRWELDPASSDDYKDRD